MTLLAGAACFYCSHGNSMEEAYCRRYVCMRNRPEVFCLEKIGDYETAVLDGAGKMSYCLFRKTSDSNYHIVDSFSMDKPEKIIWKINCWKICRRMKRHFILNI